MAISSFLVVILAVLTVNICLLIFACSVNDKACHDVVRAAARQPSYALALQFAQAELKMHKTDGNFISTVRLVNGNIVYQDFSGAPPPGQTPYVQATTAVDVNLPAPLLFIGASFTNHFTFTQTYTSPIIKTKYVLN